MKKMDGILEFVVIFSNGVNPKTFCMLNVVAFCLITVKKYNGIYVLFGCVPTLPQLYGIEVYYCSSVEYKCLFYFVFTLSVRCGKMAVHRQLVARADARLYFSTGGEGW